MVTQNKEPQEQIYECFFKSIRDAQPARGKTYYASGGKDRSTAPGDAEAD